MNLYPLKPDELNTAAHLNLYAPTIDYPPTIFPDFITNILPSRITQNAIAINENYKEIYHGCEYRFRINPRFQNKNKNEDDEISPIHEFAKEIGHCLIPDRDKSE